MLAGSLRRSGTLSSQGRARIPLRADASTLNLAIVVADYHAALGEGLLKGALECLAEHGVPAHQVHIFRVPGAFEVPQAASRLIARRAGPVDAVVALGVLIRGETL